VGLVARVLEREGLTTVSLTSAIDITERLRPPRAAFLNFPLGNATGRPHDAEGQRRVLRGVLGLAETARKPGAIVELLERWPEPDWEQETIRGYWDEAHIVRDTRLRSEYDGEENYALRECKEVCSLV
jgi:D-proline reductase (dithiol) PrdB